MVKADLNKRGLTILRDVLYQWFVADYGEVVGGFPDTACRSKFSKDLATIIDRVVALSKDSSIGVAIAVAREGVTVYVARIRKRFDGREKVCGTDPEPDGHRVD